MRMSDAKLAPEFTATLHVDSLFETITHRISRCAPRPSCACRRARSHRIESFCFFFQKEALASLQHREEAKLHPLRMPLRRAHEDMPREPEMRAFRRLEHRRGAEIDQGRVHRLAPREFRQHLGRGGTQAAWEMFRRV